MANKNGGFIGTDGLDAPDPPTAVTPTAGDEQVSVAFTAPTDTGTSAITGFVAQVSTSTGDYSAGSNTGTSSPIVVSSLTNGTAATAKVWAINAYGTSAPSDASVSFTPALPQRAFFPGGANAGGTLTQIDVITITTTGNATDFGDLSEGQQESGCASSVTRGIVFGGKKNLGSQGAGKRNLYLTLSSGGTQGTFGNLVQATTNFPGGCGNATRALKGGGGTGQFSTIIDNIEYVTIATLANATDFGDLTVARNRTTAASNSTRGIWAGGGKTSGNTSSDLYNTLDYVTIASTGNASDFGDLAANYRGQGGAANSTRALWGAGRDGGGRNGGTEYSTIASTGNASDFGNLTVARELLGSAAGETRAVFAGGYDTGFSNVIDYHEIATTASGTDFGDLAVARVEQQGLSNAHGGLQ